MQPFAVGSTGQPPLFYQWRKDGVAIHGGHADQYTTPPTSIEDNDTRYDVVITNAWGSVTSQTALLTINQPPVARDDLERVKQGRECGDLRLGKRYGSGRGPPPRDHGRASSQWNNGA